jgi:hypothetical protein
MSGREFRTSMTAHTFAKLNRIAGGKSGSRNSPGLPPPARRIHGRRPYHVSQAWNQAAALASRWTDVPSNPDRLSALQVTIDNEPLRARDAPLTTVNVTGIQTQVQINVAPGQSSLQQQLLRLREGAAFAALHAAGLDSAAPSWVVAGIAAHAGRADLTPEEVKQYSEPTGAAHFGGQQWRFERSAEDTLDYRKIDHQEAAGQVTFLLTGDDATHAPAFLTALRGVSQRCRGCRRGRPFKISGNAQPPHPALHSPIGRGLAGVCNMEKALSGTVFEPAKNAPRSYWLRSGRCS